MSYEARKIRAPAKINLGLRLLGVRSDGYNRLESVFAPIDLWDDLEVQLLPGRPGIEFEVLRPEDTQPGVLPADLSSVSDGPDNLVVRAAAAFCKETGFDRRIGLRLTKRIPVGAGLGGGSSDAAVVLLGLASLADARVTRGTLAALGLGLGADVPFFLAPAPALVSGIGEQIEPLEGVPCLDLVLVNPGFSLSTAEVYRAADARQISLTGGGPGSTMRAISRLSREKGDLTTALRDLLINDLEPAAKWLCPPIARLIERLHQVGAMGVSLSGSGATVFGVFASAELANRAAMALRRSEAGGCWVQATRIGKVD